VGEDGPGGCVRRGRGLGGGPGFVLAPAAPSRCRPVAFGLVGRVAVRGRRHRRGCRVDRRLRFELGHRRRPRSSTASEHQPGAPTSRPDMSDGERGGPLQDEQRRGVVGRLPSDCPLHRSRLPLGYDLRSGEWTDASPTDSKTRGARRGGCSPRSGRDAAPQLPDGPPRDCSHGSHPRLPRVLFRDVPEVAVVLAA